jgi:phosphoglycerate dehydrogenase-like enzyme
VGSATEEETGPGRRGAGLRGKILVTPRSLTTESHPALARLEAAGFEVVLGPAGRQPTPDELATLLPGCAGYLAGVEPVGGAVLREAAAAGLRAISRNGTGTDNIDLATAAECGVAVLRAGGANTRGVAELAWALALALARRIPASDSALKRGRWERHCGVELEGRTLGLVGCGRVGRIVAGFGTAFGMRVVAFEPSPDARASAGDGIEFGSLDDVLRSADILSLHCPPGDGPPLLTAGRLALLPADALLVNTARAELVDDAAVLAALDSGQLGGYAADVFRTEPPGDDPLAKHPKTIATPHVGAFTRESIDRATSAAVDLLLEALAAQGN